MCEKCNNHESSFISGAVFGALLGAVAGLLLAPQSGDETRRRIKKLSDEYAEKGEELLSEAELAYDKVKEKATPIIKKKIEMARELEQKIEPYKEEFIGRAQEIADDVKDRLNDEKNNLKKKFFNGIK